MDLNPRSELVKDIDEFILDSDRMKVDLTRELLFRSVIAFLLLSLMFVLLHQYALIFLVMMIPVDGFIILMDLLTTHPGKKVNDALYPTGYDYTNRRNLTEDMLYEQSKIVNQYLGRYHTVMQGMKIINDISIVISLLVIGLEFVLYFIPIFMNL